MTEESRDILDDPDGLSIDVSLGLVMRGDMRNIQSWLTDVEPIFRKHSLRLVYKRLYPGRLIITQEPIDKE